MDNAHFDKGVFVYKHTILFSDIDQFKHMSFANYLKLMYFSTDALFLNLHKKGFLERFKFVVAEANMAFKRQAVLGEEIVIRLNCDSASVDEFTLQYRFVLGSGSLDVALASQRFQIIPIRDGSSALLLELVTLLNGIRNPIINKQLIDEPI